MRANFTFTLSEASAALSEAMYSRYGIADASITISLPPVSAPNYNADSPLVANITEGLRKARAAYHESGYGNKIAAIKALRAETNMGLAEAKYMVEAVFSNL